jgi:transglutaminase-like putative cysteine protease
MTPTGALVAGVHAEWSRRTRQDPPPRRATVGPGPGVVVAGGTGPASAGRRSPTRRAGGDRINADMSGIVYRVRHRTTYGYNAPVEQSYNEAHLRPREMAGQHCVEHHIDVDPPQTSWSEHLDAFGNTVAAFVVRGGFEHLAVTATSVVARTAPEAPVPSGPPWETARRLIDADRLPPSREARRFRSASRLVPSSPRLAAYAEESFVPHRHVVEATLDLSARIHRDFLYDPGFTSVTTPLLEVFDHRRGVCQDFAHLAVGCLRSLGLAARYVSGYLETTPPPGEERLVGADASHAWASVYIPGWGWLDIDPTNDQIVDQTYVTVAWGRDYWDVSPLRGSVEGGGDSHTLAVEVDVSRVEPAGRAGEVLAGSAPG